MKRFSFSLLDGFGKRVRSWVPSSLAAGLLAAGALLAGCGGVEQEQAAGQQPLDEQGQEGCTPNGAGDCFSCSDLLAQPCDCKDAKGVVGPCAGAELAACKADQQRQYEACTREEHCQRTVLEPKLAACPDKDAPGFKDCYLAAYQAYQACAGTPGGGDGGGGTGGGTGGGGTGG